MGMSAVGRRRGLNLFLISEAISTPMLLNHWLISLEMSFDHNSADARAWAREFCRQRGEFHAKNGFVYPETPDSIECWFASAILAGMREGTQNTNEIWLNRNNK